MTSVASTAELHLFRRAHVGAARRAAHAWRLVTELNSCTVVMPYRKALDFVASAIFYNSSYDACERYESVEEFTESFEEDFVKTYPERVTVDGVECVVVRPFFTKDYGYLTHLHMTYLRGCDPKEIETLDVTTPALSETTPVGLTDDELAALVAYHRSACVKLVNRLRHLKTATCYLTTGLANAAENKFRNHPEHTMDPRAARLVSELAAVADLPFLPAPCSYFGTEADRVNKLATLAADETLLAPLLH